MTTAELAGSGRHLGIDRDPDGTLWLELGPAVEALGWKVTDAGGMLGLCPDADTCVPVPAEAVRDRGSDQAVRLDGALQDALGLAVAADDHHVVVARRASGAAGGPAAGDDLPDLGAVELPEARSGRVLGLADGERRTALYVWASW